MARFVNYKNEDYLFKKTSGLKFVELYNCKGGSIIAPIDNIKKVDVIKEDQLRKLFSSVINFYRLNDVELPRFLFDSFARAEVEMASTKLKRAAAQPRGHLKNRKSVGNINENSDNIKYHHDKPELNKWISKHLFSSKARPYYDKLESMSESWKPKPINDGTMKVQLKSD